MIVRTDTLKNKYLVIGSVALPHDAVGRSAVCD